MKIILIFIIIIFQITSLSADQPKEKNWNLLIYGGPFVNSDLIPISLQ